MKLFDLFRKKPEEPVIKFVSYIGDFSVNTPVMAAKAVKADWMKKQKDKAGPRFTNCPGLLDYSSAGFLILAHCDIHIFANESGVEVKYEQMPSLPPHLAAGLQPARFDEKMISGMVPFAEGMSENSTKIPLPWSIQMKEGWSAFVSPPRMHLGQLMDKIWIVDGVVDYDSYHTANLVFSILKPCHFTIPAGTPILHVLPFKREAVTATCGPATPDEFAKHNHSFPTRAKNAYMRYFHKKKYVHISRVGEDITMDGPKCPFHKPEKENES